MTGSAKFDPDRFSQAARLQRLDRAATPYPVPARITAALDMRELYGPEVDHACGVEEPAVDEWEAGDRIPTAEQLALLAELTGFPIRYFYQPMTGETQLTGIIICGRSGPKGGGPLRCQRVETAPPILQPKPGAPVGGHEWYGPPSPTLF